MKLIIDECQLTDEGRYQAEINGKTSKANVIVTGKNIKLKSFQTLDLERIIIQLHKSMEFRPGLMFTSFIGKQDFRRTDFGSRLLAAEGEGGGGSEGEGEGAEDRCG